MVGAIADCNTWWHSRADWDTCFCLFLNRLYPFNQIPGPSWPVPIARPSAHGASIVHLDV